MAQKTTDALLARYPHPRVLGRSMGEDRLAGAFYDELQDALTRSMSRVRADADTALLSTDGTSGSTTALYRIDLSAGDALVAGILGRFATQADIILIGAGEWAKSWALDGDPAEVLTADGKTYDLAVVALLVGGAVELHAVFGDEADDAAEVAPDDEAIAAALELADIATLNETAGLLLARVKVQRVAVDTITMTHLAGATNVALAQDRSAGNVFGT